MTPLSSGSMAEREETQWQGLALPLVKVADAVRDDSSVLQSLEGLTPDRLVFLFTDRAPSTMKKQISGWRRWVLLFVELVGLKRVDRSVARSCISWMH